MLKILFVCHGNICRSPMAEFILKDMAVKRARQMTKTDYDDYDYIIFMDRHNIRNYIIDNAENI